MGQSRKNRFIKIGREYVFCFSINKTHTIKWKADKTDNQYFPSQNVGLNKQISQKLVIFLKQGVSPSLNYTVYLVKKNLSNGKLLCGNYGVKGRNFRTISQFSKHTFPIT